MNFQDLQNLPYDKRLKIFYTVIILLSIILFGWWISDALKRLQSYRVNYPNQKAINSTMDYSQNIKKAKELMDKANQKMEEDLKKYDPELRALEQMASSSVPTSTTSTDSTSTLSTTTTINIQ